MHSFTLLVMLGFKGSLCFTTVQVKAGAARVAAGGAYIPARVSAASPAAAQPGQNQASPYALSPGTLRGQPTVPAAPFPPLLPFLAQEGLSILPLSVGHSPTHV